MMCVLPTQKSKDPSEASPGSCTHVYRTGAWGAGGLESARHLLTLSRIAFGNLYKIAQFESAVEKWDNSRDQQPETDGIACQPKQPGRRFLPRPGASKASGHRTF
jgi:hypothetical protein